VLAPMWSVLKVSQETLSSLTLSFEVVDQEMYLRLWRLHFPKLRSLSLDIWEGVRDDAKATPDKFTDFILSHGRTLEDLNLAFRNYDQPWLEFDAEKLKIDSLPRLRSFKGNIATFRPMVDARMECLRSLRILDIGPEGCSSVLVECFELFEELDRWYDGMRSLEELKLDLAWWEGELAERNTMGLVRCCGETLGRTVRVWKGDILIGMSWDDLAEAFAGFPALKVLHVRESPFYPQPGFKGSGSGSGGSVRRSDLEDFVLTIAAQCEELEEMIVSDMRPETRRQAWVETEKICVRIYWSGGRPRIGEIEEL